MSYEAMQMHICMTEQIDVKDIKCEKFDDSLYSNYDMKHHVAIHAKREFEYLENGQSYCRENQLDYPMVMHTSENKFECKECGKGCDTEGDLKQHMVVHSGETNFRCEECGKCYSTKYNLKQHKVVHSEEKNFKCQVCGKSYYRKGELKQHMAVHTEPVNKIFLLLVTKFDDIFVWATNCDVRISSVVLTLLSVTLEVVANIGLLFIHDAGSRRKESPAITPTQHTNTCESQEQRLDSKSQRWYRNSVQTARSHSDGTETVSRQEVTSMVQEQCPDSNHSGGTGTASRQQVTATVQGQRLDSKSQRWYRNNVQTASHSNGTGTVSRQQVTAMVQEQCPDSKLQR
ncbi:Zinc finger protein 234-like 2 [Homarus americanus]|uniref:Zinc finger protein 234-like 2 n=1 Tax=Homarus americanus TaxID=6706 RepID=A0A8J5JYD1_HOMAM|nr:Zinc finger protein 234-like 2 [Homarus americanus]